MKVSRLLVLSLTFVLISVMFLFSGVQTAKATDVWTVGYNGTILNTTDGGSNWSAQTSGTTQSLRGIFAVVPEPVSSTLFIIGGATLGFRRFWKKRRTA